jgi:hypothetical protein
MDRRQRPWETAVDTVVALCGEARAQEVERVGRSSSESARAPSRDKGLDRLRETVFAAGYALEKECGLPVSGELHGAVADVEQLGGNVALP